MHIYQLWGSKWRRAAAPGINIFIKYSVRRRGENWVRRIWYTYVYEVKSVLRALKWRRKKKICYFFFFLRARWRSKKKNLSLCISLSLFFFHAGHIWAYKKFNCIRYANNICRERERESSQVSPIKPHTHTLFLAHFARDVCDKKKTRIKLFSALFAPPHVIIARVRVKNYIITIIFLKTKKKNFISSISLAPLHSHQREQKFSLELARNNIVWTRF